MNLEKSGRFIAKLRKEHNMTQQQVADIAFVTRESVSKWERGVNLPDSQSLLVLSKLFGVTVNEILYGEFITDDNKEDVENATVDIMVYEREKRLRIIFGFMCMIFLLVVSFLSFYFLDNYNSIKLYVMAGEGDHFVLTQGMLLNFKNNSYVQLGEVINNSEEEISNISIVYKKDKIEDVVVSHDEIAAFSGNLDISFMSEKYKSDWMDYLYLKIVSSNIEELIKISVSLESANDKLIPNLVVTKTTEKTNEVLDDKISVASDFIINEDIFENALDKFKLIDGEYVYQGKNYRYVYDEGSNMITANNKLLIKLINNTLVYKNTIYNYVKEECIQGNCDIYKDVYDNISMDF